MMKKAIKIVGSIVAAIVILFGVFILIMNQKAKEAMSKQHNVEIDMAQVKDGTYEGESDGGMVKVKVSVEVKEHKIAAINLIEHKNGKGKPAEAIIPEMIKKNTDNVDAVSGATGSSRTIRNAVNVSLQKGL